MVTKIGLRIRMGVLYWSTFALSPLAWADVAIAPSALYFGGWMLIWPLLLGVIAVEMPLFYYLVGKKAEFTPLQVLSQIIKVNVASTLVGGLLLLLGNLLGLEDPFSPILLYFLLTLWIETLYFKKWYDPAIQREKVAFKSIWQGSLVVNLSSYLLILLALIYIPSQAQRNERSSRPVHVKSQMHSLQTMLETYGVDWGGEYPPDLAILEQAAKTHANPYWKEILTPSGDASLLKPGQAKAPFKLEYIPVKDPKSGKNLNYWLYGYNHLGKRIQDKGQDFALTNS